jgi:outer membrane protein insertion porin family
MSKLALIFVIGFVSFFGAALPASAQSSDALVQVEQIVVTGNRRVADGTVLSYLPVQVGDRVSRATLSIALERLYDTDLFKDIDISLDGQTITVTIVENPIINRVNIEGNDALSDERLLEVLDIEPRRVYTRETALQGSQRLLDIYRQSGRFAAVVEPQIIELDENRVDLAFVVNEGPMIKINSITFKGNRLYSDSALRRAIASRETKWWTIFSSADNYDEARLDYDSRLLRQFYLERGYADIEVLRVRGGLLPSRKGFAVNFLLEEGVRYKVGDISIESQIKGLDIEFLTTLFKFGDDGWYDVRLLEQGMLDLTNELGSVGYAFVNIDPEVVTDPDSQTLNIFLKIGKARKNFIERIEIVNNSRTLDSVIRREFELVEGDAFNQLKLERSIRNVRNLGYFSNVTVQNIAGSSDEQTITQLTVEEQSTGELSVGLGYSSIDKTNVVLGINEKNFLGTGRSLNASLDLSKSSTNLTLGITEPYLFGRNLTGSASVFNERVKRNTITTNKLGTDFGVGFSAADDYYHRVGYELSRTKSTTSSTKATSVTGENNKTILKSAARYSVSRDTRDNRMDPSDGSLIELSQEIAGIGGDAKYYQAIIRGAYYKPLYFNSIVLGVKGRVGSVIGLGEKVTQSQRFYIGGRSVRGFEGSGIGPRDTGSGAAVGGNNVVNGSFEIVSPLGFSKDLGMRWTVFSDFGTVWDTDFPNGVTGAKKSSLRTSVGTGILWDTYIGPMSFYWANAINSEKYDRKKTFQFTIGTRL